MAPFEALYGRKCRTPVCWNEVGERRLVGHELVQITTEKVKVVRDNLKTARNRQKSYANNRHRDLQFEIGDRVFLKISPWIEASKLRARSSRFALLQGTLYKQGFSAPLLKCIGKEDANYVLREVHKGIFGNHIGAWALVGKTLRQGHYWPTILKDATELILKCKICQEHAKISHLPSEPLTPIISP